YKTKKAQDNFTSEKLQLLLNDLWLSHVLDHLKGKVLVVHSTKSGTRQRHVARVYPNSNTEYVRQLPYHVLKLLFALGLVKVVPMVEEATRYNLTRFAHHY